MLNVFSAIYRDDNSITTSNPSCWDFVLEFFGPSPQETAPVTHVSEANQPTPRGRAALFNGLGLESHGSRKDVSRRRRSKKRYGLQVPGMDIQSLVICLSFFSLKMKMSKVRQQKITSKWIPHKDLNIKKTNLKFLGAPQIQWKKHIYIPSLKLTVCP